MVLVEKFVIQSATAALLSASLNQRSVVIRANEIQGKANENLWLNKTL